MSSPEVEWASLKAEDLRELASSGAVVLVPIGSIEQHGPHLPTQVDSLIGGEVACRAARIARVKIPIIVTPVVWSGLAEHHMSLGGTLTLDLPTFLQFLRCICRSLLRQGFRRILLLNAHGGNSAALIAITNELAVEFEAPIATATYWTLAREAFLAILEQQTTVRHACEAETSMLLALAPDLVDRERLAEAIGPTETELQDVASTAAHRWRSFASRSRHGAIGDPRSATPAKGQRLLDAAAYAVADLVCNEQFWSLAA